MKDRGKAVESSTTLLISDAFSSDPPCRKHPSSSSVGICAYCLKDRLIKLVCSDCGEQRLSSCSCSDISSNRNSCSVEVGSVGRISFLIENEKTDSTAVESGHHSKLPFQSSSKPEAATAVLLKRNRSSSVYEKRRAFWHVGWLFRKKKEMGSNVSGRNSSVVGQEGEILPSDHLGLSGSRPVVGFDESEGDFGGKNRSFLVPGSAKRDDFTQTDCGFDGEKEAGIIDLKAGLSSESKRGFSGFKSGGFTGSDTGLLGEQEAGFIDLEMDFLSKSKGGFSGLKGASLLDSEGDLGNLKVGGLSALGRFGSLRSGLLEHESDLKIGDFSALQRNGFGNMRCCSLDHEPGSLGNFSNGSSCRITVNDCEIRGGKKGLKVWKWIFKNSRGRSGRK